MLDARRVEKLKERRRMMEKEVVEVVEGRRDGEELGK